jgi:hypothetical protein
MSVPTEEAVMTVQRFFLSVGETAWVTSKFFLVGKVGK